MVKGEGNAGLNTFLAIIVSLFMIGLVAMIFILSGNAVKDVTATSSTGQLNESIILVSGICENTSVAGNDGVQLSNVIVRDITGAIVPSANYTIIGGCIKLN